MAAPQMNSLLSPTRSNSIALLGLLLSISLALSPIAYGKTTIDPQLPYAYSANAGWINFAADTDRVGVGETFIYGYAYGANIGWINLGNGAPKDGSAFNNKSESDFGVNRDSAGKLSGYAYGANIGWIHFGWADSNDPNRPQFDTKTGFFSGFAYSNTIGWISLQTDLLRTAEIRSPDTDEDGIADEWEQIYFSSLNTAGLGTDSDGDGQSDAAEAIASTDPNDSNSYLRIVDYIIDDGITEVTVTFSSSPVLQYKIEYNSDLTQNWSDSGLDSISPDSGATTTKTFSATTDSNLFFRVIAIKTPTLIEAP